MGGGEKRAAHLIIKNSIKEKMHELPYKSQLRR
jgi:hypothetical protein